MADIASESQMGMMAHKKKNREPQHTKSLLNDHDADVVSQ